MSCFSEIINNSPQFQTVLSGIRNTRLPMGVLGLSHIHKAHLIMSSCQILERKGIVITPDEPQATRLAEDLCGLGANAFHFPARDFILRATEGNSREYEHLRLRVLGHMVQNDYDTLFTGAQRGEVTSPRSHSQ